MKSKIKINSYVSLIEIVFSILIFAITGAIMLQCFGTAKSTQLKTNDKVIAGNIIQSHAEMIKSFDTSSNMITYLLENFNHNSKNENENTFINYYDRNWNISSEDNKEYYVKVTVKNIPYIYGDMVEINIISEKTTAYEFINNNSQPVVYEINTKSFFPSIEGRW